MSGQNAFRRLTVIFVCLLLSVGTAAAVNRPDLDGTAETGTAETGSVEGRPEAAQSGVGALTADQVPLRPAEAIGALLDTRATALLNGDRATWLSGVAQPEADPSAQPEADPSAQPGVPPSAAVPSGSARVGVFRAAQARVFDQLRTVRPVAWSYQVMGGSALPVDRRAQLGGVAWLAEVQLAYRLTEAGPTVNRRHHLTVVRQGDDWVLADDADGPTTRDVWDLVRGPLARAESERCLVIGAAERRTQIRQLATECGVPAETVDAAWGLPWTDRTVFTVADDLPQLGILLGRPGASAAEVSTAGLEQTAAVTLGPADSAADGVLINGEAFDRLSHLGRQVVLTHELVHVAARATGATAAPIWLAEGYADQVAYAGLPLTPDQIAGDALAAVRVGRVPLRLPEPDDFNAAGSEAAAAYGRSWVAVELLAETVGDPQRLAALYRQLAVPGSGPVEVNAVLLRVGVGGTSGFIDLWQARLQQLASGSTT